MEREKILVVDDEKDVRETLCEFVMGEGYIAKWAKNGHEAEIKSMKEKYDLALVDIKMPDMDGLNLIDRIKKNNPECLFIVITGYPSFESSIKAIKLGVYNYINKPFDLNELRNSIKKAFEKKNLKEKNKELLMELKKENEKINEANKSLEILLEGRKELLRKKEKEISIMLRKREKEVKKTREKIILAQEIERKKIASELHDGLTQIISAVNYNLEAYLNKYRGMGKDNLKELREIKKLIIEGIEESRRIIDELRPPVLDEVGLTSAIERYIRRARIESGLNINIFDETNGESFPANIETAIYRVAREAIFNAQKHANAKKIEVNLKRKDSELILKVNDDGRGFDIEEIDKSEDNWGIVGMRERAEILGGSLDIKSSPGKGTRVMLSLPFYE